GTLRVVCNADACADVCPPPVQKNNVPAVVSTVVLHGEALFEQEWNTDAKLRCQTVSLTPDAATVAGVEYTDFDSFCAAITDLVADCNCDCD
ncbi:hypothetical protein C7N43_38985, partial [Sphingobacteriales bacterium UPWRP_1]